MLPQSSDNIMFTNSSDSSDMPNKNTLGIKSTSSIRSSPTYVRPKALIAHIGRARS